MASKTKAKPVVNKTECDKCLKEIKTSAYLQCSQCSQKYHIECTTNVTFKRFQIMKKDTRDSWRCKNCHQSDSGPINIQIIPATSKTVTRSTNKNKIVLNESQDNITFRKIRTVQPSQSFDDSFSDSDMEFRESLSHDDTARSLPSMSTIEDPQIAELKSEIDCLSIQLTSAHDEIARLNGDIIALKKHLNEKEKKLDLMKKIAVENGPPRTPNRKITSLKISRVSSGGSNTTTPTKCDNPTKGPQSHSLTQNQSPQQFFTPQSSGGMDTPPKQRKITRDNSVTPHLMIISTNNKLKMLSIAEEAFQSNVKLCHYLLPRRGIRELFADIKTKTMDLVMKDFCIIFLGEEDFNSTMNYFELVRYIRVQLQQIDNTNIIICLPTFRYNSSSCVFNSRIEIFNTLIYLDNESHKYAILIDSNVTLSYSNEMFSKTNGKLNNRGLRNIFGQLELTLEIIGGYNLPIRNQDFVELETPYSVQQPPKRKFFREERKSY